MPELTQAEWTLYAAKIGEATLLREEIARLRQALADIQFDLINCHQSAGRDACEHIQDAIKIVNRTLTGG